MISGIILADIILIVITLSGITLSGIMLIVITLSGIILAGIIRTRQFANDQ